MTNFDDKIRAALSQTDQKLYDSLSEPSLFEMAAETFSGRLKWLTILAGLLTAVFTGLAIYCAYQFFQSTEVQPMIGWSAGFLFCATITMYMKLWTWLRMERVAVVREIKRLELQVAVLSGELKSAA